MKLILIVILLVFTGCSRLKGPMGDTGAQGEQGTQGQDGINGQDGDDSDAGDMFTYTGFIPWDQCITIPVLKSKCILQVSIDINRDSLYEPTTRYAIDYFKGQLHFSDTTGTPYWITILIT